jgi:hypothetical protein
METRGIRLTQLPSITGGVPNSGVGKEAILIVQNDRTRRIDTDSFYRSFSGVKNFTNLGDKLKIFDNQSNNTLYFNTLTATGSLSSRLNSNFIELTLVDSGVSTQKIQNGAVTPAKQSGTLTSSVNLTAFTQTIAAGTFAYITGLTVNVTPPTINSKVLLGGYISIGCADAGLNIYRSVNGGAFSTVMPISASAASNLSKITMIDVGQGVPNNAITVPISFLDSPNTTNSVTYSFGISAVSVCNINKPVTAPGTAVISYSTSHIYAVVLP